MPVDIRPVAFVCGILLIVVAAAMLPPMVADFVAGNPDWQVFLLSSAITAFVGVSLVLMHRHSELSALGTRQAFLMTTSIWVMVAFFSALPFAFSGLDAADAFFEAMSGITTTGSTVMTGLDFKPPGILLWRALLQWLGGIGIIVMAVSVLPVLSIGGMQLFRTESSEKSDKILPRAGQVASAIGLVYLVLTVACALGYLAIGMTTFDAVAHAMTTIATGGFSTHDLSLGFYVSPYAEWTALAFMLMGGLPFVLYIHAFRGNLRPLYRDVQVHWFLGIALVASLAIVVWLGANEVRIDEGVIRRTLFTVVSIITGTGYSVEDYGRWGTFPIALLFFLKCVGGCTGSTTGGIKVFRFIVLYQVARAQILRLLQPNGVFRMTYNERAISNVTAISVTAFFFVFALSFAAVALLLGIMGLDYLTAMSASVTALSNVGPGLGPIIGPVGHFGTLPDGAKWVLAFAMLLGRLELFTVLVLFTPLFWRP